MSIAKKFLETIGESKVSESSVDLKKVKTTGMMSNTKTAIDTLVKLGAVGTFDADNSSGKGKINFSEFEVDVGGENIYITAKVMVKGNTAKALEALDKFTKEINGLN